jgi:molybdopterin converting factor small subunit
VRANSDIIIILREAGPLMRVEFLAVPRRLTGISEVEVQAETLGQLVEILAKRFPLLGEYITTDRLHPSFVANLNGDEFVSDPRTVLSKDDHVLILSADAGG